MKKRTKKKLKLVPKFILDIETNGAWDLVTEDFSVYYGLVFIFGAVLYWFGYLIAGIKCSFVSCVPAFTWLPHILMVVSPFFIAVPVFLSILRPRIYFEEEQDE